MNIIPVEVEKYYKNKIVFNDNIQFIYFLKGTLFIVPLYVLYRQKFKDILTLICTLMLENNFCTNIRELFLEVYLHSSVFMILSYSHWLYGSIM